MPDIWTFCPHCMSRQVFEFVGAWSGYNHYHCKVHTYFMCKVKETKDEAVSRVD